VCADVCERERERSRDVSLQLVDTHADTVHRSAHAHTTLAKKEKSNVSQRMKCWVRFISIVSRSLDIENS
jgi:hypothetical protein